METFERELLVARIVSGTTRCRIKDQTFLLKQPDREAAYIANELFAEIFRESELQGLYTEEELFEFLVSESLWDEPSEKMLLALPKEIEEFKVKLYKLTFKSYERAVARKALGVAKEKLNGLLMQRHAYAHLSCLGAANLARARYLLGCSIYYSNGKPVFTSDSFWTESSDLLDELSGAHAAQLIEDHQLRELARTEPWRVIWMCKGAEGSLFGRPAVDLTSDQRSLVCWSNLYDNIHEHPDCPSDEIVADDDMLDGWLIDQRRIREKRQLQKTGEEVVTNEKIRNSQEIFIVAETLKDAQKINELNDDHTKNVLKQRFNFLKKKGVVNEADMPDTKRNIMMEQAKLRVPGKGQNG